LFGKTPLKAQNDYVFQKFEGSHGPFAPPGYAYASTPSDLGLMVATIVLTLIRIFNKQLKTSRFLVRAAIAQLLTSA